MHEYFFGHICNTIYSPVYNRNKTNTEDITPYEVSCCIILLMINLFLFGSFNKLVQSNYNLLKLFHIFNCLLLEDFSLLCYRNK